jgi:membrane-associated protease RseP (regulator of RpoE activity)
MDTATLVLIVLCIVYIPIWFWVWRNPEKAERLHLMKYGPTIMIKTQLGIKSMERIGKYRRLWLGFGFISKLISAILFFVMMYMLIVAIIALPTRLGSGGIGIQYALAIPGFNPMLPLTYGIVALCFAMVVHEMGHGIQSRANGIKVDSTGLLYGVVPLGAFCEPNEEELTKSSRRVRMDIYSAGISVNTFCAVIAIALMLLVCGGIGIAEFEGAEDAEDIPGVYYIDEDSPAFDSGVTTSALILGIKEVGETQYHSVTPVSNSKTVAFTSDIEMTPLKTYQLRYVLKDGVYRESAPLQMGVLIKGVTNNSPANKAGLEPLTFLESVTITHGDSAPVDYRISNTYDFIEMMSSTSPGDIAVVTTATIADGGVIETVQHDPVTLTSSGSIGYLGITTSNSGFTLTTPEIMMDKATDPFANCSSPIDYVEALLSYLAGPINGLDPIPDKITWWYDAPSGNLTWIVVKMLYWIFWLDILLAISNALPAFPFDGGFLFEGGINWLLERLGIKDSGRREKLSHSISSSISTVVLLMFFLVLLTFII